MTHLRPLWGCLVLACATRPPLDTTQDPRPEAEPEAQAESPPLGRLPADVRPERYTLTLEIVPDRDRFSGVALIEVRLDRSRDVLWLHGLDLAASAVTVTPAGGDPIAATWEQVDEEGVVALRPKSAVGPGKATLRIAYDAPFNRQLRGLYRIHHDGESYAFTQFEAIDARRAFPGFDEPAFKVPFDITLRVRADHVGLGNTPTIEEKDLDDGLKEVRLATTKPMPTYLVAFAVGPLDVVDGKIPANEIRGQPLPFRGVAAKGRGGDLDHALEHTGGILAELERYFGTPYPYAKLDVVAVPDFAGGAMENVGLVTFREPLLLLSPERATEQQRRGFASVMAHELAHMWFGNLVTMPWWDDIWLNEAFATWMTSKVIEVLHPEHKADVRRIERTHDVMGADSRLSARQIRQPVDSPHDIRNAFDGITYVKGGAVLHMFERWLGPETFRDGLRLYMERHAWKTATYQNLLDALGEAAGKDVATPFETFLLQPGLPLIEATLDCAEGGAKLLVRQSRYLPVGSPEEERGRSWKLPVCVRYGGGGKARTSCAVVASSEGVVPLEGACPAWVLPNADGAGYYRWALPRKDVDALLDGAWKRLTTSEKLSLADAVAAGVRAGVIGAGDALRLLAPLASEADRSLATAPMAMIDLARERLVDDALRPRVEAYARKLYRPVLERLGWNARKREDGETRLLRSDVIAFLVETGRDDALREQAARRGRNVLGLDATNGKPRPDAVSPDLVPTVLRAAVREGDVTIFDAAERAYTASRDSLLRNQLLEALSATHDPTLGERAMRLSLDERVRINEMATPLWVQAGMRETRARAWNWLRENAGKIEERASPTRVGSMPWMAASFCSEERAKEVEEFFGPMIDRLPGGPRNLAGALESIRQCAALVSAQSKSAREFFEGQ